jgi:hypothetical protein
MNKFFVACLLVALTGCVAPEFHGLVVAQSAAAAPVIASAMPGWPSPQEPLDTTPITPTESLGASSAE